VHAVTRALLPALRAAQGRIVTIGSISGRMAAPMLGAYAMSKFALEAWSDALRVELAPQGVEVALIEPGPIATPLWPKSMTFNRRLTEELEPGELKRCRELYGGLMDAVGSYILKAEATALPPEHVVRAIEHALMAARPRARYPIGLQARLRVWGAALIPDRIRDALIKRLLKL
jgi:short-subunit dehydrogenase